MWWYPQVVQYVHFAMVFCIRSNSNIVTKSLSFDAAIYCMHCSIMTSCMDYILIGSSKIKHVFFSPIFTTCCWLCTVLLMSAIGSIWIHLSICSINPRSLRNPAVQGLTPSSYAHLFVFMSILNPAYSVNDRMLIRSVLLQSNLPLPRYVCWVAIAITVFPHKASKIWTQTSIRLYRSQLHCWEFQLLLCPSA